MTTQEAIDVIIESGAEIRYEDAKDGSNSTRFYICKPDGSPFEVDVVIAAWQVLTAAQTLPLDALANI